MQTLARDVVSALLQATGGGLLVAVFAFVACRAFGKLTASIRFGLWWLVGAKFLLGLALALLGVAALQIPILRAEHYYTLKVFARETVAQAGRIAPVRQSKGVDESGPGMPRVVPRQVKTVLMPPAPATPLRLSTVRRVVEKSLLPCYLPIVCLYLIGVLIGMTRAFYGMLAIRRLIAGSEVCENAAAIADIQYIARKIGLRRTPTVLISLCTSSPFVVGIRKPSVVLPASFLAEHSTTRRMVLAHEMAHIHRNDLLLEVVPFLLRTIFWFLPPAYFTYAEIASAREEACDLIAVKACETSPTQYASLLISVAERARAPLPVLAMAAPASRGFRQIKRRLRTLAREANGRPVSLLWRSVALTLLVAQAITTLLPLRPALARAAEVARAALPTPRTTRYRITDLGTLGGKHSGAFSINDAGQVVGTAHVYPLGSRGHAFLWDGDTLHDLTSGSIYRHSQAVAIADNGAVAGFAYRTSYRSGQQNAFVWNGNRRIYLPPASGFHFARPSGISDTGAVVGASLSGSNDPYGATVAQATLWQNNQIRNLGTLGGGHSFALAINRNGTVVGKADLVETPEGIRRTHPFVWNADDETMQDLGTLGGNSGAACAVNENGVVVGYAQTKRGEVHAFATSIHASASPQDLGVLAGYTYTAAYSVNENGTIVGQASLPRKTGCAVIWTSTDARAVDLNKCLLPADRFAGWHLETARGINSQGQIVGQGIIHGKRHAFVLTPVNE